MHSQDLANLHIINYINPCHGLSLLFKLTSSSGVFPENITLPQVTKKHPNIYGNRMLVTTLTKAYHLSLTWPRSHSPHTSKPISLGFTLILFFLLRQSPRWPHSLGSPHQNPVCTSLSPTSATYTGHLFLVGYDHRNNIWWGVQITKLPLCSLLHYRVTCSLLGANVCLSNLLCGTPSAHVLPSVLETKFHNYRQSCSSVYFNVNVLDSKLEDKRFWTAWK